MSKDFGSIWEMLWDMLVYLPRTVVDLFHYGEVNGIGLLLTLVLLAVLVAAVRFGGPHLRAMTARRRAVAAIRRTCAERGIAVSVSHGKQKGADLLLVGETYRGAVKFFPGVGRDRYVHFLDAETCLVARHVIDPRSADARAGAVQLAFRAESCEKIWLFVPRAAELTQQRANGEKAPIREGEAAFGIYMHSEGSLLRRLDAI